LSLPEFQNANLISRISILTNTFELLNIPNSHVQLINRIPVENYSDIVGIHLCFDKITDTIKFINNNQEVLYGMFVSCEITEFSILCYGVTNND